jgi:threonine aldolase
MKEQKEGASRRAFFRSGAMATLPLLIPASGFGAYKEFTDQQPDSGTSGSPVNFAFDGPWFTPQAYMEKLQEIDQANPIEPDIYSSGGVTRKLEVEFARITGKEKAIYLPTGTMANQVAMKLLNGDNTKVIVPENSHIFRDEADAAQSVHGLRTIPLGKGRPYFDLPELKVAIDYLDESEVFKSGLGTVVIENPIRRADGTVIPMGTIREITDYCKAQGYKLHLDGARLHIASAWSKVPVSEYSSHFDTVYVSLYKYLNAAGGGILCGDATLIDQVPHQIKILGGSMLHSWTNTAMALHYLERAEKTWDQIRKAGESLIAQLNQVKGTQITAVENGSNVFVLELDNGISFGDFAGHLYTGYNIQMRPPDADGNLRLKINETLLSRDTDKIVAAWQSALAAASA